MKKKDSMDNYHLIKQIGEGSFGKVFKARRKYTGRLVAIKMINKAGQSKDDLESFRREIDLLQKVSHPNVMRMLEVFEIDTDFCVVSELARGDLFQVIDDNQTLPENVLKSVAAQLISSLAHLHSLHIIHRDMKPQNILIAEHGALKICDFGFARALSNTTLVLTSIKGTPLYMAPELVQEQPYDEKVDIWALGVILYELYYGRPPYFTNSIYKLVQMIVNSPIPWPGDISSEFKSFLLEMLNKEPSKRKSCQELLKHPFISDVDLSKFDDRIYRFKSNQFERAIANSLNSSKSTFKPKKSTIPDFQAIFFNPSSYSEEELILAIQYLREKNITPDNPQAMSFSEHFPIFINRPSVVNEALALASELLRKDLERFSVPFAYGINILGSDLPPSSIDFFTELLTIPFAQNMIQNIDFQLGDLRLTDGKCTKLRDRLLRFIYTESDQNFVSRVYSIFSFFAQESDIFLNNISYEFAPQLVPILVSAIISDKIANIKTCAFCILSKIIEQNPESVQSIQPINDFLDGFYKIIQSDFKNIEEMSLFSAAVSFIAIGLSSLAEVPEFQKRFSVRQSLSTLPNFVEMMFKGKSGLKSRLETLLLYGSQNPATQSEQLSLMSVLSSPFYHFPMNSSLVELCTEHITSLIPFHQPGLLDTLLNLQPKSVQSFLPSMVGLFAMPKCANQLSEYILSVIGEKTKEASSDQEEFVHSLCDAGIFTQIASVICDLGPSVPPNVVIVLAQLVMAFKKSSDQLISQATEILNSVFSIDSAAESGLIIASHLARLSKDFLPALTECGALNLAERALQSEVNLIRARALDFVGNICRHIALPDDYIDQFIPLLIENLNESDVLCKKLAAFALGNVLFWSPDACDAVMPEIDLVVNLLSSNDLKTVENAAGVLGNIVRKSQKYVNDLINNGALEKILLSVQNYPNLQGRTILPLSYFCQYEEPRKFLKAKKAQNILANFTNSQNERVRKYAKSIIDSIS